MSMYGKQTFTTTLLQYNNFNREAYPSILYSQQIILFFIYLFNITITIFFGQMFTRFLARRIAFLSKIFVTLMTTSRVSCQSILQEDFCRPFWTFLNYPQRLPKMFLWQPRPTAYPVLKQTQGSKCQEWATVIE